MLKFRGAQFKALGVETAANFFWGANLADFALVNEGDAVAAFGFVEIRSGHDDGEAFSGKVRDRKSVV